MSQTPVTALAVLAPIDIDAIPDVGHASLAPLETQRAGTLRNIRRSGIAVLMGALLASAGAAASAPLILAAAFAAMTGGALGFGWNILRLVQANRTRQMYETAYDPRLAVTEGNVRKAAEWWNGAYAALREALIDSDADTPPRTLASIARGIAELERMRVTIDERIAALRRRNALPPAPEDP